MNKSIPINYYEKRRMEHLSFCMDIQDMLGVVDPVTYREVVILQKQMVANEDKQEGPKA